MLLTSWALSACKDDGDPSTDGVGGLGGGDATGGADGSGASHGTGGGAATGGSHASGGSDASGGSQSGNAEERTLLGPEGNGAPIDVGEEYRLTEQCPTTSGDAFPQLRFSSDLTVTPEGMPLLLCKGAAPNLMGGAVRLDGDREIDLYVTGDILVQAMAQSVEGDVFLGGRLGTSNEYGAAIAKYDDEGVLLWSDSWEAGTQAQTDAIAVAPDGSIYATGRSNGVAPDNPETASSGRWLARYESSGDRMWIEQYPVDAVSTSLLSGTTIAPLVVATTGEIYAAGGDEWLEVFDADGGLLSHTQAPESSAGLQLRLGHLAMASDGYSLFTGSGRLLNFSLDGTLNWSAELEPHPGPSASDEPAQPGLGAPGVGAQLLVQEESLFIAGGYAATAESHSALVYVGRYDMEGERAWVQQYVLVNGVANHSMAWLPSGNLLMLVRVNGGSEGFTGTYVFEVDPADGLLL